MNKDTVGVVGAGSWGTTLAKILGENGHETLIWAYEAEVCEEVNAEHRNSRYIPGVELGPRVHATTDLQRVCESCDFLLMVVPSHVFRKVAYEMGAHLRGDHIIVHGTKGIEQESFKRMSEILREETCVRKIGALCGPNLAKELADRQPAGTLVASKYDEVVKRAQHYLHNAYFRVYGGHDMVGAEVGGAFKNVVAVSAGVVDGLKLGDNTKALLLTRGLNEMARYGTSLGADVITFGGMAGIGDLMATCASPHSRNHQVGERLARGETMEQITTSMYMVAEGVKTARSVHAYASYKGLELPIVDAAYALVHQGKNVRQAMDELMTRDVRQEFIDVRL
jgi:glycerol-3-phosphate dehydrogenase (NAD(P)+)